MALKLAIIEDEDDIGPVAGFVELLEADRLAAELVRQFDSTVVGSIGNKDRCRAMREQVPGGKLAHLARAHQVHVFAVQRTEDLLGELNGHGRNGHGRRSHSCFGAHSFGHRKRPGQQRVKLRMNGPDCARYRVGLFHLAENLRFSNHHRIEAGSDPEQVTDGILLPVLVEVVRQFRSINPEIFANETAQVGAPILGVGEYFHPVAGREYHALFDSGIGSQGPAGLRQARIGNSQPLAHLDRRTDVIDADELQVHEATNL